MGWPIINSCERMRSVSRMGSPAERQRSRKRRAWDRAGVPIAVRLRDDYESWRLNSGRISVNLSPPAPGQLAQCLVMLVGLNPWRGSLTDGVPSHTVSQEGRSMTEPLKRDTVESGSMRPSGDCRALGPSGTAGDERNGRADAECRCPSRERAGASPLAPTVEVLDGPHSRLARRNPAGLNSPRENRKDPHV